MFGLPTYRILDKSDEKGGERIYVEFLHDVQIPAFLTETEKDNLAYQLGKIMFLAPILGIGDLYGGNLFTTPEGIQVIDGEVIGNFHLRKNVNEIFIGTFAPFSDFNDKTVYCIGRPIPGVIENISGKDKIMRIATNTVNDDVDVQKYTQDKWEACKRGWLDAVQTAREVFKSPEDLVSLYLQFTNCRLVPLATNLFFEYAEKKKTFDELQMLQQATQCLTDCVLEIVDYFARRGYIDAKSKIDTKTFLRELEKTFTSGDVPFFEYSLPDRQITINGNPIVTGIPLDILSITRRTMELLSYQMATRNFASLMPEDNVSVSVQPEAR